MEISPKMTSDAPLGRLGRPLGCLGRPLGCLVGRLGRLGRLGHVGHLGRRTRSSEGVAIPRSNLSVTRSTLSFVRL